MSDEQKRSIELEIKESLEIDEADILGELTRHSAHYFYWGVMWAKAARAHRKQKLLSKQLEAKLANGLRETLSTSDPKARVTEAMKNDYLYNHPEYLEMEQALIQSEYMEEVLDVAKDGMKQRGQALQELARQNREERIYGDEFRAMKNEYDTRVEEKPKRHRRTKLEMEAIKTEEKEENKA